MTRNHSETSTLFAGTNRTRTRVLHALAAALLFAGLASGTAHAVTTSAGYSQSVIATSFAPTGGVVVVGGEALVGSGSFGGATQSIVRVDAGGETVIADGFNSLSGFLYDATNDLLIVGDNALEAAGSETGDTLYGIPNPFGHSGTPLRANTIELLPQGSISSPVDLAFDPADPSGNSLFVANSASPAAEILSVALSSSSTSVLQTALVFSGGIAATPTSLIFGELAFSPGSTGTIYSTALPGGTGPRSTLVSSLVGQNDLLIAADGTLLASNSEFFGPSTLDRYDPATGALIETIASDFDFATAIAADGDVLYAIEGGFSPTQGILRFTPIPEPGTGLLVLAGLSALAQRRRGARS